MTGGGFIYESKVIRALGRAGIRGTVRKPAGANSTAPDADIVVDGVRYNVEVKMDRGAQMGGSSVRWQYGVVGVEFVTPPDQVIAATINDVMSSKVDSLIDFVDFVRHVKGNDDFWGWPGKLTRKGWDAARRSGVLAQIQTRIPYDATWITHHYNRKGINYIQIGGAGLFCMGSNPADLPVPQLAGHVVIEIRAARNATYVRKQDRRAVVGSGLRVQARLKASGTSPYTLDSVSSIRSMLAGRS